MTLPSSVNNLSKIVVVVPNFKNPSSVTVINSIGATITGTSTYSYNQGQLSGFTADTLTAATLTPMSDYIGQTGVSLKISITTKNILPSNGKILVTFPQWGKG